MLTDLSTGSNAGVFVAPGPRRPTQGAEACPSDPPPGPQERTRLAVAGLALSGGPGPDQPARVAARLQPVAEVLASYALQQPDVGLERRDQFPALFPGQRPPGRAVPLYHPLQRIGHRAHAGYDRARRGADPQCPRESAVPERFGWMDSHVLTGYLGDCLLYTSPSPRD